MLNSKLWFLSASLLLGCSALCSALCSAQECQSCEGHGFGYPGRAHTGRIAAHHQAAKENWHAWKAESAKIYARNDAWPKPFICQDRVAYYSVWETMINHGYAHNCVLGADHFEGDSNDLNQAGRIKIANIMQNLPTDRRHLLVTRSHDEKVSQNRLASVNQVVQTYYGRSAGNTMIGLTELQPSMMSGVQADAIVKRQLEGLPSPIIPVSSIGAGVSESAQQ